jgi:hypothetical protein
MLEKGIVMKSGLGALAVLWFLVLTPPALAADKAAPQIAAIRAQLFYEETGRFSDDILARKEPALWNTFIGEGDAEEASTSTLVTVEVRGKDVPVGSVKVEIVARGEKGKVLSKRLIVVSLYSQKTTFFAPLWLNDTACEPIEISARLIGKGVPKTHVKKTIPFACGE